jgi:hypothetical protein
MSVIEQIEPAQEDQKYLMQNNSMVSTLGESARDTSNTRQGYTGKYTPATPSELFDSHLVM